MAIRFTNPAPRFFNDNAALLVSGRLTFFEPDGSSTKKPTFKEVTLDTENANPVILTKGGVVPEIWLDGTYRWTLEERLSDGTFVQVDVRNPIGETSDFTFADWSESVGYGVGGNNIVTGSDGLYYVSIQTPNLGNDPTTSPAFWSQVTFIRVWNTNETYAVDVTVRGSNGSLYRALVSQSGNDPITDETNWRSIGSVKYDDTVNYFAGDIAQDTDDEYYISIDDTNVGNDPSSTPTKWTNIKFVKVWNTNETYDADEIVKAGDFLYRSLAGANSGNDPEASTVSWEPVDITTYDAAKTYKIGDVVKETTGLMWRSITNSNTGNTPNSTPSDWLAVVATGDTPEGVFLSAASASSDATIEFALTGVFDEYELRLLNVIPASDDVVARIRTSTDGGTIFDSGASDYQYQVTAFLSAAIGNNSSASSSIELCPNTAAQGVGNAANEQGISGVLRIIRPAEATFTVMNFVGGYFRADGPRHLGLNCDGNRLAAEDVTDIQFSFDTGNVATGLYALYGINRS